MRKWQITVREAASKEQSTKKVNIQAQDMSSLFEHQVYVWFDADGAVVYMVVAHLFVEAKSWPLPAGE